VKQSSCEVLPDRTFLDLLRPDDRTDPRLVLWRDGDQIVGDTVENCGEQYRPRPIPKSILRSLNLPARVDSRGSVPDQVAEVGRLIDHFVGLPEKFTALTSRFVLATWVVDAIPTAPRILIEGPDSPRARQLLDLLHCICRRALRLGALTPAGFHCLPSGMHFTILLDQPSLSAQLSAILKTTTIRGNAVSRSGELVDLFGARAILSEAGFDGDLWRGAIRIPCLPTGSRPPLLDREQQRRIVDDLQPKLLGFRFSNYQEASVTKFETSRFAVPLQDLAAGLAAATPGHPDLQAELHALLRDENAEIDAASWVGSDSVILEAILVFCREAQLKSAYIKEITEMANGILAGRGEDRRLDAGDVGRRIGNLGFSKEPRDERGVRLSFSNATCVRAHELAHLFNVPGVRECSCRNVGNVGNFNGTRALP
jgi:hypothetical protein